MHKGEAPIDRPILKPTPDGTIPTSTVHANNHYQLPLSMDAKDFGTILAGPRQKKLKVREQFM